MTFRKFIRAQRVTKTGRGNSIADVKADRDFPNVKDWGQLLDHLTLDRNACPRAAEQARPLWDEFEQQSEVENQHEAHLPLRSG
jgi:hypothetical protein